MSLAAEYKKCPYCRETIVLAATRCKHCQADLPSPKNRLAWLRKQNTFRTGFLSGIAFTLCIFLLGWLHFFAQK